MTGGADTHYEDFTSGLRDFVAARRLAAAATTGGGSTLVGGWFGGAGADPSAVVLGIDWLAGDDKETATPESSRSRGAEAAPSAVVLGIDWLAGDETATPESSGGSDDEETATPESFGSSDDEETATPESSRSGDRSGLVLGAAAGPEKKARAAACPGGGGISTLIVNTEKPRVFSRIEPPGGEAAPFWRGARGLAPRAEKPSLGKSQVRESRTAQVENLNVFVTNRQQPDDRTGFAVRSGGPP